MLCHNGYSSCAPNAMWTEHEHRNSSVAIIDYTWEHDMTRAQFENSKNNTNDRLPSKLLINLKFSWWWLSAMQFRRVVLISAKLFRILLLNIESNLHFFLTCFAPSATCVFRHLCSIWLSGLGVYKIFWNCLWFRHSKTWGSTRNQWVNVNQHFYTDTGTGRF